MSDLFQVKTIGLCCFKTNKILFSLYYWRSENIICMFLLKFVIFYKKKMF